VIAAVLHHFAVINVARANLLSPITKQLLKTLLIETVYMYFLSYFLVLHTDDEVCHLLLINEYL